MVITLTLQGILDDEYKDLIDAIRRSNDNKLIGYTNMDAWFFDNYGATPANNKDRWEGSSNVYKYQFPTQESYMEFCLKWL